MLYVANEIGPDLRHRANEVAGEVGKGAVLVGKVGLGLAAGPHDEEERLDGGDCAWTRAPMPDLT